MAGRLQGKVAVITGASRGLGQYVAVGYAKEGARVVIAARTETESNPQLPGTIYHTAKLVEEAGGEAFPVVCNVADAESIDAMTKAVLDKWGRIDIVMPNAAVQPPGFVRRSSRATGSSSSASTYTGRSTRFAAPCRR